MNHPHIVFFIGRPGCGKGTQTKLLSDRTGWSTFSTGNRFKELRDGESDVSARVRESFDKGQLLPNWFADYFFMDAVMGHGREGGSGLICEGYPRALPQAHVVEEVLGWLEKDYVVVELDVSEDEAMKRQLGRAKHEHRPDSDDETKIRERLATFTAATEPVIAFFKEKGRLITVNGEQSIEAIAAEVAKALQVA